MLSGDTENILKDPTRTPRSRPTVYEMKDTAGRIKGRSDVAENKTDELGRPAEETERKHAEKGPRREGKRVRDLRANLVRRARDEPSNGRTEKRDENLKEIIAKVVLRFPNSWPQTIHPQIRGIRQARSVRMWPGDRLQR